MSASLPASSVPTDRTGLAFAVVSALAFSTLGLWGKLATAVGLGTYGALSWRFGLVALILLPLSRGLTWAQRRQMLAVGSLYSLATVGYFSALGRITLGTTALLLYLAPAFVVLLAWRFGRRPGRAQLGALGLGLVIGVPGAGARDVTGLLFGAGAGALYAAYLLASERWLRGLPALACTAHMALASAVVFTGLCARVGELRLPETAAGWGVIAGMVGIATLIAVPTLHGAVARLGAARASLVSTLEPLFAVLLAALVLGEPLRPAVLLGGGFILAGAVLSQRH